jgi:hypothetical protein
MTTTLRAPRTGAPPALTLEVEHGLVTQFRIEAARRDMPVTRLLHDLLDVIAAENFAATATMTMSDTAMIHSDRL